MPKIVATKEDWIKLGYKLFSESGEQGLIVEKMSDILKCNKSSFYWHFKSKSEFINELIEYWTNKSTLDIIDHINQESNSHEKWHSLITLTFKKDVHLDFIFYLKKYAQSHISIKKFVDQIDHDRIEYVTDLLKEFGYTTSEAKIKAHLFYKYLIGYHEMLRYKNQPRNYVSQVKKEINHFIKI